MIAGFSPGPLFALPEGGHVVAGSASIQSAGTGLTVTQATDRAAINWQTFGIAANEAVRFNQPTASSVVLNRVLGQDPSQIFGSLSANGQVFILNPNGVLFGQGAQVNVGGLVASTLNLSDADFLAGRYTFSKAPGAGAVLNQGTITAASGGYVALIAPQVANDGVINAQLGTVTLAAGEQVTLNLSGRSLVSIAVDRGALDALASNRQLISADGGQVFLSARSADALARSVVNNTGIIQANTITSTNGVIRLEGGTVTNSGTISATGGGRIALLAESDVTLAPSSVIAASGANGGEVSVQAKAGTLLADGRIEAIGSESSGGSIRLLGTSVGLLGQTAIDASGRTGGGTVLVGGDFQGKNPDVQNSQRTYVGPGASIKADASGDGSGGKVVVWADGDTRYYGGISATGGASGGGGGFVEISGKEHLVFKGAVDTRARDGSAGTLLLDPANITIQNGTGDGNDADAATNSFAGTPSGAVGTVLAGDATPTTLFQSELEGIAATTNISLAASNSITINNLTSNVLNLAQTAGRSVTFSSGAGGFSMNTGDTIQTAGGALTITTTGGATLGGLATAGGAITLSVGTASTASGVISGAGTTLTKQGTGTLTLSGANTYTGATTVSAGVLDIQNSSALGSTGAGTTVASGAALQIDGSGLTIAEPLTLNGTGVGAGGALRNLANSNTVSGAITLASASRINSDAGTLTISGGGISGAGQALSVGGAGNTTLNTDIGITTGTLTKDGAGTLTLNAATSYTGLTTVSAGTLSYGVSNALNTGAVAVSGGTWNIGAFSDTVGAVTLTGGSITGTTGVLTGASYAVQNGAISAILAGAGALTKTTAGTVTLAGANTYGGATNINGGTLSISADNNLGTAPAVATANQLGLNGGTL
ncbi:MAG TPA: filamentous hemagglutinin N-terminal domain-containing protein, partial [Burkholderiales bacterium]|nr:filamentous hemagglutinin N-terminal domain-containing protein [Burkholderiales bacterium]